MIESPASAVPLRLGGLEPFEGPLDVLLTLLDGEPQRILRVSLADLTTQYLAWLAAAQQRGLAKKLEFVEIAAHLIRLKAQSLWEQIGPPVPTAPAKPTPKQELQALAEQLLQRQEELAAERKKFRAIAEMLQNDSLVQEASLPRGRELATSERTHLRLSDLLVHIREVRRQYALPIRHYTVTPDGMSESDMYAWLSAELQRSRELDFSGAMQARRSRPEQCRLFSALLQGCKSGIWIIVQEQVFGPVRILAVS